MRDWIMGLEKAAAERKPGVGDFEWSGLEAELRRPVPDELRDLYSQMDGAGFPSGVKLYPLQPNGGAKSVVAESRASDETWAFGERGDGAVLFAIRRGPLVMEMENQAVPEWVQGLDEGQWVYGLRREEGEVKFYRSLEHLLGVLVPPVQTEEFGDITYARAINALEGALQGLGSEEDDADEVADADEEVDEPDEKPARAASAAPAANRDAEAETTVRERIRAKVKGKAAAKAKSSVKSKPKAKAKVKAKPVTAKTKTKAKKAPPTRRQASARGGKVQKKAAAGRGKRAAGTRKKVTRPAKARAAQSAHGAKAKTAKRAPVRKVKGRSRR
ncbi:MAG TPA: hypothetical protein VEY30_02655 [Myxococcaceae bacterium]|nr:hypothetical protein [Myxococcaceae bacterium]